MRLAKTAVGVAGLLACLIVGASVALGAGSSGTPAGGRIQLFVQPGQSQGKGKVLFTGAVGDYGSSSPTTGGGAKSRDGDTRGHDHDRPDGHLDEGR